MVAAAAVVGAAPTADEAAVVAVDLAAGNPGWGAVALIAACIRSGTAFYFVSRPRRERSLWHTRLALFYRKK
jgi:hypothetical protein